MQEEKGSQEIHRVLTRPKLPLIKKTVTETPHELDVSRYPKRTRRQPECS